MNKLLHIKRWLAEGKLKVPKRLLVLLWVAEVEVSPFIPIIEEWLIIVNISQALIFIVPAGVAHKPVATVNPQDAKCEISDVLARMYFSLGFLRHADDLMFFSSTFLSSPAGPAGKWVFGSTFVTVVEFFHCDILRGLFFGNEISELGFILLLSSFLFFLFFLFEFEHVNCLLDEEDHLPFDGCGVFFL